ncbi:MAG: tail fiber protein [Silvibacterium sp.]|jgi:microcystin-dependent protein
MSQPYVGEVRMFAGNFAPAGWMFCEGQLLPISEYETLFNLIGTTYGGDGQSTFQLPDLRGRLPVHQGNGFTLAQTGGAENVNLATAQIPAHTHAVIVTSDSNNASLPGGNFLASGPDIYDQNAAASSTMAAAISSAGGSQPHSNFQPYLCVDFIISLFGIFPSQG